MAVAALGKPAGRRCAYQTDSGCGRYARRPSACRDWHCMWVRDDGRVFAEDHRPDKLGLFFTASRPDPATGRQVIHAHPVRAAAALEPAAAEVIEHLRRFATIEMLPYHPPIGGDRSARLTRNGRAITVEN